MEFEPSSLPLSYTGVLAKVSCDEGIFVPPNPGEGLSKVPHRQQLKTDSQGLVNNSQGLGSFWVVRGTAALQFRLPSVNRNIGILNIDLLWLGQALWVLRILISESPLQAHWEHHLDPPAHIPFLGPGANKVTGAGLRALSRPSPCRSASEKDKEVSSKTEKESGGDGENAGGVREKGKCTLSFLTAGGSG